jgi:hypothetical protein
MGIERPRRTFLREGIVASASLVFLGSRARGTTAPAASPPKPADVNATEDLMREHGVLRRVLLVYGEEVFPKIVATGKLTGLVTVLLSQHQAGRKLTASILAGSTPAALASKSQSKVLAGVLGQFIRMYEPHAAREDTVLFPAFHALFTEKEFDALGDRFEEKEHAVLGDAGFEGAVAQVAQLEKALGIYDLAQFT